MITSNGKLQHLSLLAGKAYSFADRFVLGASPVVIDESATDLDFSWGSFPITDSIVDHDLQQVVFYGTIPAELAGEIQEIGLASIDERIIESGRPINMTFFFGSEEGWIPSDEEEIDNVAGEAKMGAEGLSWESIAADQAIRLQGLGLDISDVNLVKSRIVADSPAQIEVSFFSNDVENATKQIALTEGVNLIKTNLSDFTTTEGFNTQSIVAIQIKIIEGSDNLNLDCLILSNSNNGGLVVRQIPANPIMKTGGTTMEVEMAVMLSV